MMIPTITLAIMIITPATIIKGRCPMVMDMRSEPDPVMIGMMIIAPELPAGAFSGIWGGVAMTRGEVPGAWGRLRAGRGTGLVAKGVPSPSTYEVCCPGDYAIDDLVNTANRLIHLSSTP